MPTEEEIVANLERLYETESLRGDLNDTEATILLKWGESQIERIAEAYPDDFEEKCLSLRQLLKSINHFIGQRQFNEFQTQQEYMSKVTPHLPDLGWDSITDELLFSVLPEDKSDMNGSLQAILALLTPTEESVEDDSPPDTGTNDSAVLPEAEKIENEAPPLENINDDSINHSETTNTRGIEDRYGEEESE